ncbi:MAG: acyltransferase, partial [Actinomycetota bacterium]
MSDPTSSRFSLIARASSRARPDIQTLRAIAVLAVLAYHLFPAQISGGFVGVDVFFAISGYLIIGHLLRGLQSRGRVGLADFWARRARRLLPASLLVLVASGVATVLLVPQVLWSEWFKELTASAAYVQNWLLSINAVDYLGADSGPSPSQHYWSLSVEEQLYIIWPLVLVIIVALAGRTRTRAINLTIGVVLVAATVASFIYSVWDVAVDPAAAYFVTPARAWEFGAGGLLAYFAWLPGRGRLHLRTAAVWLGLAMILLSVLLYTAKTPFPGATALVPVIGTLLVIWADQPGTRWSPRVVLSIRPVIWIGDISYSLYLWHWPLIILIPAATGRDLSTLERFGIVLVSIVLAWFTKRFVEDPVRV